MVALLALPCFSVPSTQVTALMCRHLKTWKGYYPSSPIHIVPTYVLLFMATWNLRICQELSSNLFIVIRGYVTQCNYFQAKVVYVWVRCVSRVDADTQKNWGLLHSPYKFPLLVRSLVLCFFLSQKLSKCNLRLNCAHAASLEFSMFFANVLALHNSKQQYHLSFCSAIAKVPQISQDLFISLVFLHFTSRCCQSRFLHFQYVVIHLTTTYIIVGTNKIKWPAFISFVMCF